jgi:hypothetical protein
VDVTLSQIQVMSRAQKEMAVVAPPIISEELGRVLNIKYWLVKRDALTRLLWRSGRFSLSELDRYFNVSYTAISNCRRQGLAYIGRNRTIKKLLTNAGSKV